MGLVLGGHTNAANAGIEGVGQGEVNDAGLAAEIDGGLRAAIRQLLEAASATTGQHIGHGVA